MPFQCSESAMSFEKPSVVIVGGGAMGGLFAGLLGEGGLDVTIVDVSAPQVEAINRQGLKIVGFGGDRAVPVKATTDAGSVKSADVVLFQCKAFANEAAAQSVKHLFGGETVAVTFQNGLGSEETLGAVLGAEHVLGGLTAQAGLMIEPGVVRDYGKLPTYLGEWTGGLSGRTTAIAEAFTRHNLPTQASPDIRREKWKKLLGNVALGAISAATDLTSAEIVAVPEMQSVVMRALDEAAAVARADGVALGADEAREVFKKITTVTGGGTGGAKSSMCEDVRRKRQTEIDTIHGAVARLGRKHGVPTPTIDTMIAIVKGLESHYLKAGRQNGHQ